MGLRDEILEQPAVARRLLESAWPRIEEIGASLRADHVEAILIAARGTSDHAAIYGQYVFGVHHRLPVALAAPSVVSLYDAAPRLHRVLVVGISQSGRSPDVVSVVTASAAQGAPTIAITNDPSSDLARAARWVVDLGAGEERAVAATKTYTAELLAVAMLSTALEGSVATRTGRRAELDGVPATLVDALTVEPAVEEAARKRRSIDRAIVLGRGFEYATAREWALKLKELCRVLADPYSSADFEHGPLALVEPGLPVFAVVPSGPAWPDLSALLLRLGTEFGADVLVLSDRPDAASLGDLLPLPANLPEWLRPIASIVPAQLFALHLAVAKGLDPERPAHIAKVTLTR